METYTCDICGKISGNSEPDILVYGDWMIRQRLTVHYFCLLLSTDLQQRGGDSSGILGFLLRDIRQEAIAAKQRKCVYCKERGASIACHGCRERFHLACSLNHRATFEFCGEFRTYCEECTPLDNYKRKLLANPPQDKCCDICLKEITPFVLQNVAYGDCCRKGFAHRSCMRRYALASGYYLRCIWCRKDNFRDIIRLQSIFVPDRDATWERQQNAYEDLHRKHMRCVQEKCLCPKGRDCNKANWLIYPCKCCASTGAHLKCLKGISRQSRASSPVDFKCETCLYVEEKLLHNKLRAMQKTFDSTSERIDKSIYVTKSAPDMSVNLNTEAPVFSDEEEDSECSSRASIITVVASQPESCRATPKRDIDRSSSPQSMEVDIIEIPDTQSQSPNSSLTDLSLHLNPDAVPAGSEEEHSNCSLKTVILPSNEATETTQPDNMPEAIVELPVTQSQSQTRGLVIRQSFQCAGEPFFYLVIYEFDDTLEPGNCVGSCTLRFAEDDPRLGDRSPEALQNISITQADILYRATDRGVISQIDDKT